MTIHRVDLHFILEPESSPYGGHYRLLIRDIGKNVCVVQYITLRDLMDKSIMDHVWRSLRSQLDQAVKRGS